MSDINYLRARLAQEESRNRELLGYLMELESGVASAHREISDYQSKVQNSLKESNGRINSSHENIIRAHELQLEIDKMYERFKRMELANKKIRACNNKKYDDFKDYRTIRKIVQGMLDNLNLNMISDAVIYKSVEKEHLKTPDYWLTSVLLSIMAWKNDDKALADRAMEISIQLDKKNSSIFYMLFNIRMGREDAALKWFMLYQECELKGSDQETFLMLFSMLSKTLKDNVEDKVKYEIADYINRVISMNTKSEGYDEQEILDSIEHSFSRMKDDDQLKTTMLRRCLTDYEDMADIVVLAQNNIHILQFIIDVSNVSDVEKNMYLEKFINDEIQKPNKVEADVYDEIEYNELIIASKGDMQLADAIYTERQEKRNNELSLVSNMIDWIYNQTSDEYVNGQVKKNMFTLTIDLQRKAAEQYAKHYRSRQKDIHPASLGDYSTEVDFNNPEGERQKITTYYETERDHQLSQINFMIAIVGAVVGIGGLALTIYMKNPMCLFISLIGVALVAYNIISNNMQRKHIQETCLLNIKSKNDTMDSLFMEYQEYKRVYTEYDAYFDQVLEKIDQF